MKKNFRAVGAALSGLSRVAAAPETLDISVDEIHENPRNVRTQYDSAGLDELAESIRQKGVLEPLLVAPRDEGGYLLLAGHRRRRAAILAELPTVPAIVRRDIDPDDHEKIALIENLQREGLGPMDIALGLQAALAIDIRKHGEHGARARLAREIGKQAAYVTRHLALLELPEDIQQLARDGVVVDPQRLAKLGMLDDDARQAEIARILDPSEPATPPLAAAAADAKAGKGGSTSRVKSSTTSDPNVEALARRFGEHLATTVSITRKGQGGEIRIAFTDNEVFAGLIQRLGLPNPDD